MLTAQSERAYRYKGTELALPAGSLQCALYAFRGGADAVYLGMKNFSARKGAVNFTFEELRKLKTVCVQQNKRFYVTLNTLVNDDDIPQIMQMLHRLEMIHPDGVIIQDLGIAKIIRDCFPSLEMHASTQLAAHSVYAVKELQHLGFTRVVLSRELSFEEISEIRRECPDVELKVFIHGALCYGFSGLCMASEKITGRSANCGACAQICRTWFGNGEENRYFFSMKDLQLDSLVRQYRDIKIDSLKVEGRMKGPDYVYRCARYYSLLLAGHSEAEAEVQSAEEAMKISFSRETTEGFFNTGKNGSCNSRRMICTSYPSHMGVTAGYIEKVMKGKAVIHFTVPAARHDGLLVVYENQSAGFSLDIEGRLSFVETDTSATVSFPSDKFSKLPIRGTPVYCVSRHNMNLPLISENITLYKQPIRLAVKIEDNTVTVNGRKFETEVQQALHPADMNEIFRKIFEASDRSFFSCGELGIENLSSYKDPFIPLSVLKQIRRDFYAEIDSKFENYIPIIPDCPEPVKFTPDSTAVHLEPVMFSEKEYYKSLETDRPLFAGLNNIAHVLWAKQHPETEVFADIFLYVHNRFAYSLLKEELPALKGTVGTEDVTPETVPLFISRVCYRHNALGKSCKDCNRDNTYQITQKGKHYTVHCKNCITTVTEEKRQ